jgi:hypothetical protein
MIIFTQIGEKHGIKTEFDPMARYREICILETHRPPYDIPTLSGGFGAKIFWTDG